jgi:hypothetical protein
VRYSGLFVFNNLRVSGMNVFQIKMTGLNIEKINYEDNELLRFELYPLNLLCVVSHPFCLNF